MQTGALLLSYGLILLVLFFPVLFLDRTLDPSQFVPGVYMEGPQPDTQLQTPNFVNDAGAATWAFQPWNHLISSSLKGGELPLWNPYQGTGVPLAANFQSGVFTPLQWPFFLSTSTVYWDWIYVFRLLLAGMFTCLFLGRLNLSRSASWLGGLCFMLSGYLIDYINMNHLNVELLLPALFYFGERWIQESRGRELAMFVICLSLSVLGGMPEATLLLWIYLFSYLLFRLLTRGSRTRQFLLTGLAGCLAVLCSSLLLLPGFEYILYGAGKHFGVQWGITTLTPRSLVTLLVPYFFGFPGPGWHPGVDKGFGALSGIGLVPVSLALFAFLGRGPRWPFFFGIFALAGLLKIFGFPGLNSIGYLPILDTVIFTKYLQPSIAFAVAVLAALGFQRLKSVDLWERRYLGLIPLLLSGFVLLLYLYYYRQIWSHTWQLGTVVTAYVLFAVFVGTSCALLLSRIWPEILQVALSRASSRPAEGLPEFSRSLSLNLIFMLAVCEILFLAVRIHPPEVEAAESPAFVETLKERTKDNYRISGAYVLFPNLSTTYQLSDLRVLDPLLPRRFVEFGDELLSRPLTSRLTGLDLWDYSHPFLDLASVRYVVAQRDLRNYFFRLSPRTPADPMPVGDNLVIDLLTFESPVAFNLPYPASGDELAFRFIARAGEQVRLVIGRDGKEHIVTLPPGELVEEWISLNGLGEKGPLEFSFEGEGEVRAALFLEGSDETLVPVYSDPGSPVMIFERPSALPVYRLVRKVRCLEAENQIEEMVRPSFNARTTILVEDCSAVPDAILASAAPVKGAVRVVHRTANTVELEVRADRPALLFIGQTYFPGWTVSLDGEPASLIRANYLFSAVAVPAGDHRVELSYQPDSLRFGFLLTLAGLLLTAIASARIKSD